jgi:hypothetical protein
VGHASPRWKGAKTRSEADQNNLELSQKRVREVRQAVERIIRFELQDHNVSFKFQESQAPADNLQTVLIDDDAKGSEETLAEASGNRSAIGKQFQRVDVRVVLTHLIEGSAPSQQFKSVSHSSASKKWALRLGGSIDVHAVVGVSITSILLKNLETHRSPNWVNGAIIAYGFGGNVFGFLKKSKDWDKIKDVVLNAADKLSTAGVSYSFGDWVEFQTDTPKRFYDFDQALIRLTTFGVSLFIGGSLTKVTIYGFGSDAESMDHSGLDLGKLKLGGYVDHGYIDLALHKGIDDDVYKGKVVDVWERYQRQEPHHFFHHVEFELEEHEMSHDQKTKLTSIVAQVCQNYVSSLTKPTDSD